ncbi:MAG: DUF302 domain-containing protein [Nitrospirota bacterium]|nr:DUF302 domain-containing protein [Nitrospirota bacterium]
MFRQKMIGFLSAGVVGGAVFLMQPAVGEAASAVKVATHQDFATTVANLKKAVSSNGMMVMGSINQGKMLSMTGLTLKSETFFVGNPMMAKKLFTSEPGAGVAVPIRVTVYVAGNGKTYAIYTPPSELLAGTHNKMAVKMGKMLDKKIGMLVRGLGR